MCHATYNEEHICRLPDVCIDWTSYPQTRRSLSISSLHPLTLLNTTSATTVLPGMSQSDSATGIRIGAGPLLSRDEVSSVRRLPSLFLLFSIMPLYAGLYGDENEGGNSCLLGAAALWPLALLSGGGTVGCLTGLPGLLLDCGRPGCDVLGLLLDWGGLGCAALEGPGRPVLESCGDVSC